MIIMRKMKMMHMQMKMKRKQIEDKKEESLIYLSSKSFFKQMRKALTNVPGPTLQQVRLDVSEAVAG